MRKTKTSLIILASTALVGLVWGEVVFAQPLIYEVRERPNGREYVSDEIIVKFRGDREPFKVMKVPAGKVLEKTREYRQRGDVLYAEPNYLAYTQLVPNDTYYNYQWHLDNSVYGGINMEEAWNISSGAGVTVAVVDTGIRKGTDLASTCFVSGRDFVNNDNNPTDDNGHGTHVAGTIAQSTNNSLGVAGAAFNSCLMPLKVLDSQGSGGYANIANGIRFAADNGAKVINLSLGGTADSSTLKDAVAYAYEKGVIVVAACGNDNQPNCLYPAAYDDYVIAVGATRYDETKAPYSNYGPSLDLVAPGGDLSVDQNNDDYGDGVLQQTFQIRGWRITWGYYFFEGTSMATPHVAGAAALVLSNGNATTPDEVRTALQETAEYKGTADRDSTYGWGLVDAFAALGWVSGPKPNQPPVANAGLNQTVSDTDGNGVESVTLDGSGSYDSDGTIVSYKWSEGATLLDTTAMITYDFAVGTHIVTLTVTDDDGATASDEVVVTVNENQAPFANAGPDQSAYVSEAVYFDGSGSTDDGTIVSYDWDFGDGTTGTGASVSHIYSAVGTYDAVLTVTDNGGLTNSDTAVITISEVPAAPTAWANVELTKQANWRWWRVSATITVKENDAGGPAVDAVTVEGTWSGAYSGSVSGTTDTNGTVSFRTGFIRNSGEVAFTVNRIVKDGQEYILAGETSDSIANSSSDGGGRFR